jgi:hypothetical protein
VLALLLPACGSSLPVTTRDTPYAGPQATIDSTGATHTVVIQAPTPGYTVSLDALRDRLHGREALITIRRPDPRFVVAQMIVTQRIGTDVPRAIPLDVYIRELEHDSRDNQAYVFVSTAEGAPSTPELVPGEESHVPSP